MTISPLEVLERTRSYVVVDEERALVERELSHHYQVVRHLGRGGMGSVYLARDVALHRHVALKVLHADAEAIVESRARFLREARLSAQLNHPGIVPLHSFGETPRLMYMVMHYVSGESLAQRLRREHRLAHGETRTMLCDVAAALDYAHRQGVVHRDLKPENVLLCREAHQALLADFGVATRRSWDPVRGELHRAFGTPHFMSPEQAMGEVDLDGRSDIYGLGVLGFLMLSGRLPFVGVTFEEIAAKHLNEAPPSLARLAPGVLRDLVAAIERCLAKDPSNRWHHASDLRDALTRRFRVFWSRRAH